MGSKKYQKLPKHSKQKMKLISPSSTVLATLLALTTAKLSDPVRDALDNCILDKCVKEYKSPDCQTCHQNCFDNFKGVKRWDCMGEASESDSCYSTCNSEEDSQSNWHFFTCKKRCKKAAGLPKGNKDDDEAIQALEAVEAKPDGQKELSEEQLERKNNRLQKKFDKKADKLAKKVERKQTKREERKKSRKANKPKGPRKIEGLDYQALNKCLYDQCYTTFLTAECAECKSTCHKSGVTTDEEGNSTFSFKTAKKCMQKDGCHRNKDCKVDGGMKKKREYRECRQTCIDGASPEGGEEPQFLQ